MSQSVRTCFTWSDKFLVLFLQKIVSATSTSLGHVREDEHRRKSTKIHLLVSARQVYRGVI